MEVYYKHFYSGKIKKVKRGYSWTTLFFGSFVPLLRGDWKYFGITLLTSFFFTGIVSMIGIPELSNLSTIAWAVWAFYYNKFYEDELVRKDYVLMQ